MGFLLTPQPKPDMVSTMKRSSSTFSSVLSSVKKNIVRAGFEASVLESSADSVSIVAHSRKLAGKFLQVLNLTEDRPGFVVIEIFVSNLSTTEKWVDVEVGTEVLPGLILEMMKTAAKELAARALPEKSLAAVSGRIEAMEPKLALRVHELHRLEDQLKEAAEGTPAHRRILARMGRVEDACLRSEMGISRLALRYFRGAIAPIDPFFFDALARVKWGATGK